MTKNVHILTSGEKKCSTLLDALEDVVYERGVGMPIASILGTIELLKDLIKEKELSK